MAKKRERVEDFTSMTPSEYATEAGRAAGTGIRAPLKATADLARLTAQGYGILGRGVARGVASAGRGFVSGLTGTPEAAAAPVAPMARTRTPSAATAEPQFTGTGEPVFTSSIRPTRVRPAAAPAAAPTVAPPVAPAAAMTGLEPEAPTGAGPTPLTQPAAPVPPVTQPPAVAVPTAPGASQAMTSPAALRLAQQMAVERGAARMTTQTGNQRLRDLFGVQGEQLARQWADAERNAFLSAMSPEQQARFLREEQAREMEKIRAYEATPQAIESRRGAQTAVDIARAEAEAAAAKANVPIEAERVRQAGERETRAADRAAIAEEGKLTREQQATLKREELRSAEKVAEGKTLSTIEAYRKDFAALLNNKELAPDDLKARIDLLKQEYGLAPEAPAAPANPVAASVAALKTPPAQPAAPALVTVRGPSGRTKDMPIGEANILLARGGYSIVK